MTIRTELQADARALILAVTSATDAKVIDAGAKGPRPAKPYLTVRATSVGGNALGPAERLDTLSAGVPQVTMRERREATISIQGYGVESYTWLEQLQIGIDSPASLAAQTTIGAAALVRTGVADLSALLGTEEETRCSMELTLRYQARSAAAAQVAVASIIIDPLTLTRYDGDPDTLDGSFALDGAGSPIAIP